MAPVAVCHACYPGVFWLFLCVNIGDEDALLLDIPMLWLLQVMVLCDIQNSHESLLTHC